MNPILPGATLGILGGGQLGRMFAFAAKRMGYRVIVLDHAPDSPCGQVSDEQIVAEFDDKDAALRMGDQCDVVTYEFENIDAGAVEFLEGLGKPVRPGSRVLRVSQDRLLEKNFLRDAGLGVTEFLAVDSREDLAKAGKTVGFPGFLKTVRGGYDGKGQARVKDMAEAEAAFARLHKGSPLIWEKGVDFSMELSVIACRGIDGISAAYPPAENVHVENILDVSLVPARIPPEIAERASAMARRVGEGLGIVGAYCVELFLARSGELLVNEIAPRPHNSGHYTIDACDCSQFEQQVRAICGLPLGSVAVPRPTAMVNILGQGKGDRLLGVDEALREEGLALHLYGKPRAAAKRKMGHFTVTGVSAEDVLEKAARARRVLHWGR